MTVQQIYVKTAKGIEEVSHRSGQLRLRERQLLILLDGKRSLEGIVGAEGAAEQREMLEKLLSEGYITALATVAQAGEKRAPAPDNDAERLAMARNFMMNTLRTFLGASCSSQVAQIDACTDFEGLRAQFYGWRQAMDLTAASRKELPALERRLAALLS